MVLAVAALAKPPLWDKRVDKAKSRFKVLKKFDSVAVLDNETGLVWQRAPPTHLRPRIDGPHDATSG